MVAYIKKNSNIIIISFLLFVTFIFLDSIVGKSILHGSVYNSYELQVKSWLDGRIFLDQNYPYLELAIYNGHYFVSFPPFPSVFLLPFVIIFQDNIPTNLIAFVVFTSCFILIYKMAKEFKNSDFVSILLAIAFTIGCNIVVLAIDSGVWFIAQLLNYFFCLLAIKSFLKGQKTRVYLYLAFAVGCRPFSAIYMVMFFVYYLIKEKDMSLYQRFLLNIKPIIPAMIVAVIYMTYNYMRFDNIFEFGHNYLPEHINSEYGQFNMRYLLPNLKQLFFNKIHFNERLNMTFDMPFCFLIANPITIVYLYRSIKNIIKTKKIDILRVVILISVIINIIAICMHNTLGGWQYGARYTCDFLPFILLGIIWKKNKKGNILKIELNKFEIMMIILGVIINLFGVILFYTNKLF